MSDKERAAKNIGMFLETFFTGLVLADCTMAVTKDYKFKVIDNKTGFKLTLTAQEMNDRLEEFERRVNEL